jgi:ketosteroid isomerase-like protein
MCVAPSAIQHLFDRLKSGGYPAAEMGGIYANKSGYHNCRDALPASDYSVQQPDDQKGSGNNASALDVTLRNPADMKRITQRLIDLTNAGDPRVQVLREFFGTVDGVTVTGRDVRTKQIVYSDDDSHLWHCHISVYRRWAADDALDDVADAILGKTSTPDNPDAHYPWPGPQMGDPEMLFVRVVDENNAIYALAPGYKHHCDSEEWGAANAAGFDCPNVNKRQRDVLYAMVNSQTVKVAE